jgi:hypothetical protein
MDNYTKLADSITKFYFPKPNERLGVQHLQGRRESSEEQSKVQESKETTRQVNQTQRIQITQT